MVEPNVNGGAGQTEATESVELESFELLEVEDLGVTHRGSDRPLLANVTFELAEGRFGIVTGRSGVGKSLLFQAILGLLPEDLFEVTGNIRYRGRLILGSGGYDRSALQQCLGGNIAAIFQEPTSHLHPSLSIGWQLRETWNAASWRLTPDDRQTARDRLAQVALTDDDRDPLLSRYSFQLSQGQQQRVMIAMAIGGAELVLADEPTSSLDEATEQEIVQLVKSLRDAGSLSSLLAITHNLDAFRPFLRSGDWVLEIARVEGVGRQTASRTVESVPVLQLQDEDAPIQPSPSPETEPLLAVDDLSVEAGGRWYRRPRRLLERISFKVEEGEFFSVTGPSGCGKTTLAKALLGLIEPSGGRILFRRSAGSEIDELRPARSQALRRQIQMIFQDALSTFDPKSTVGDSLREILHFAGVKDTDEQVGRLNPLLENLGLVASGADPEEVLARFPAEFSGGQRQRLGVVRALLLEPRLLIADEPFASQDIETALDMVSLFRKMGERYRVALVLISHDRRLVNLLCGGGIELRDGTIVDDGTESADSSTVSVVGQTADAAEEP